MTLTRRFVLLAALLVTIVALVVGLMIVAIQQYGEAQDEADQLRGAIAAASEVEREAVEVRVTAGAQVLVPSERFRNRSQEAVKRMETALRRFEELTQDPPETRAAAQQTRQAVDDFQREYVESIINQLRTDPAAARRRVADSEEAPMQTARLRRSFAALRQVQEQAVADRAEDAEQAKDRAVIAAIAAGVGLVLLLGGAVLYQSRTVVRPLRRLADAASDMAAGNLGVRVEVHGHDEISEVARSFNGMAASLDATHSEAESQNAELAQVNEQLRMRGDELQSAARSLREEKGRLESLSTFSQELIATSGLSAIAELTLRGAAEVTGAEIGTVHAGPGLRLLAIQGVAPDSAPASVSSGEGLGGRAVAERITVDIPSELNRKAAEGIAAGVTLGRQVHVPLINNNEVVGVLALGWLSAQPLDRATLDLLEQLARQSAVALASSAAADQVRELADVNRAVIEASRDAISLQAHDGSLILANQAMRHYALDVWGRPMEELSDLIYDLAGALTNPRAYLEVMQIISDDSEEETFDEFEIADTGRIFTRYTRRVTVAGRKRLGRLVVVREVTAERQSERSKEAFVANVSHEVRTPLSGIIGFSELLLAREFTSEERDRHLQTIHHEAQRLSSLIDDFLDLQGMDQARFRIVPRRVDIRDVVAQQVDAYSGRDEDHPIVLDLADEPLESNVDGLRVGQVVANLLSNAIKYSPEGGEIAVRAWREDALIRVEVVDHGLGVPAGAVNHVFDRFYRVEHRGYERIGGTGLGLALARELVEMHGGHIGVDTSEGEGSRFWFTLPAAD
ncbi:MAG: HAMP domain-containing protein [Solirubrobacteraceae bacterium]|nr:HAMP domain-containing protein [Solirubrobacteraceae bacterium]